jgi:selenocysteine lyase/cysteine desulfurase
LELAKLMMTKSLERGYEITGPKPEDEGVSGIVTLASSVHDLGAVHKSMLENGLVTSLRRRRDGGRLLRISAHAYNREDEIERVLAYL